MTGTGTALDPFRADGLSIVVSGTPQAGDSLLIRPTHDVVAGLKVLINSPDRIAAAAPLLTTPADHQHRHRRHQRRHGHQPGRLGARPATR